MLSALPAEVTHCNPPALLPSTALTQADVERYWARDRAGLILCTQKLDAVVNYYEDLRTRFDWSGQS